jgi:hypothetical protein
MLFKKKPVIMAVISRPFRFLFRRDWQATEALGMLGGYPVVLVDELFLSVKTKRPCFRSEERVIPILFHTTLWHLFKFAATVPSISGCTVRDL